MYGKQAIDSRAITPFWAYAIFAFTKADLAIKHGFFQISYFFIIFNDFRLMLDYTYRSNQTILSQNRKAIKFIFGLKIDVFDKKNN